ncbi:MAG TPA: DUF120 domain-containing protein [archaeon]|nr:DUF120 domain-containing protein [archaeon]
MDIKGKVISGAMRGSPLIDIYFHRLIGIIGFEPYKGTLDIRLEKAIDIKKFSTKAIEHVLLDGSRKTDAYLAPIEIVVGGERYGCWAMRQKEYIYSDTRLEIISKENIKEKFSLKDDDDIIIVMNEIPRKKKKKLRFIKNIYGSDRQLMKRK